MSSAALLPLFGKILLRNVRRGGVVSLVVLLWVCASGCLSRPNLNARKFMLEPGSVDGETIPAPPKFKDPLVLQTISVAAPFESRQFIYRTSQFGYESDAYHGFLVTAHMALKDPIWENLRRTGLFENMLDQAIGLSSRYVLSIHVTELYGDFREANQPRAMLSARFIIYHISENRSRSILLQKQYSRSAPLKERSAEALVAGWNGELADIINDFAGDLRQLPDPPPPAPSPEPAR